MVNPAFPPPADPRPPSPPTLVETIGYAVDNLLLASIGVGVAGGAALYVFSLFAEITGGIYSDGVYFPGWGGRFLTWCAELLDQNINWFLAYVGVLVLVPCLLLWLAHLVGLRQILNRARSKFERLGPGRPYPGRLLVRCIAGGLGLPFLPTILAGLIGCLILALVMAAIALYALVVLGRAGGFRYAITRAAVRDGMRDAVNGRRR